MDPFVNIHTHQQFSYDSINIYNNCFNFDKEVIINSQFSIGIHPWDVTLKLDVSEMEQYIMHNNCFAIGECGIDKVKGPSIELQIKVLVAQLQLAVKYNKPVIIHCVKAFDELIKVCQPYLQKINFVFHGFNKSMQLASQLTAKGFYISLNLAVLKKEDFNLEVIPLNKIFFETDKADSVSIVNVYKMASLKLDIDLDALREKIYDNFIKFKQPLQ